MKKIENNESLIFSDKLKIYSFKTSEYLKEHQEIAQEIYRNKKQKPNKY
jgi:hypothetical protein